RPRQPVLAGGRRRVLRGAAAPAARLRRHRDGRRRLRRGLVVDSAAMADEAILELYRREITPELYTEIRELWKTHSIAEDARDLPGLISTLTEDCVYELA